MLHCDTVPENDFFSDDVRMIADLLKDSWSLEPGKEPSIGYTPESYITSARYGSIYVYMLNRSNQITTTDYRTLQRVAHIGIKVTARHRVPYFEMCQEVYRIILANRRCGVHRLNGYSFMEIQNERQSNDLTGWYTCTFDIKLTGFAKPIHSAGFGDDVNRMVDCPCEDDLNINGDDDSCQA